jgi:Bacterial antitoxin of type II TA system, VapB
MASVKKTWLIDPVLVQRARRICGARTETETVTRALREIIIRDEIEKAFRKYGPELAETEIVFPDRSLSRRR